MITFLAKSVDGKLNLGSEANRIRLSEWLKNNPDKYLRIEPQIGKRTLQQDRFYWFYLGLISRDCGHSPNELHAHFREAHIPSKWILVFGKTTEIRKSTADMNKTEFSEYLDRICAECNVPIPDSEQYLKYIETAPLINE